MKKWTTLVLAMGMTLALAACNVKDAGAGSGAESSNAGQSSAAGNAGGTGNPDDGKGGAANSDAGTGTAEGSGGTGSAVGAADARELLTLVWDSHSEDEKFPAMGGDFDEANMTNDAPGNYGLGDTAALDATLRLPESAVPMIDGAASLMHMMNANTFTCGAFHVSDSANVSAVADALKENILSTQWMCGFPEKLIVITVEDYVISAFGNGELIDTFRDKTLSIYPSAQLAYEQMIE